MPELAVFFGISITIFYEDHDPPHIHASHGSKGMRFRASDWVAQITIGDGRVIGGLIPARDLKLVRTWLRLHDKALQAAWAAAKQGTPPGRIPPLRVR